MMNRAQLHSLYFVKNRLMRVYIPLCVLSLIASLMLFTTQASSARAEGYYKLTLTHLSVNERRANGKSWDMRDGLPDLFISVYINGATIIQRPLRRDAASVNVEVESEAFDITGHVKLEVIVYDKDISTDDYIDNLTAIIRPQELGELTYSKGLIKRVDFTLSLTRAGEESVARQVAELKAKSEAKARREAEARAQEAVEARQRAEAEARVEREARIAAEARSQDVDAPQGGAKAEGVKAEGAQTEEIKPGLSKAGGSKSGTMRADSPRGESPTTGQETSR